MPKYLIGAGGWAYFQVSGMHPLVAYSRAFNFVEVNSTFYKTPNLKLVKSWRRLVLPDFEFAVRCNRALTHKYKFQPTSKAFQVLEKMIAICNTLKAEILHLQTPATFQPTQSNGELLGNFFSSMNLEGIQVAMEMRGVKQPVDSRFVKTMQDLNLIHCVDLSKNEEPVYESDILYSRLFGKGSQNIYQPTDDELRKIDMKTSARKFKTVAISFHFVKMYKDAGRYKIYKETGKFPMITKSQGTDSLAEVLQEDAKFPSNRGELIHRQGWKLIDLAEDKRVLASHLLMKLPEKTYNSIDEVVQTLKSLNSW